METDVLKIDLPYTYQVWQETGVFIEVLKDCVLSQIKFNTNGTVFNLYDVNHNLLLTKEISEQQVTLNFPMKAGEKYYLQVWASRGGYGFPSLPLKSEKGYFQVLSGSIGKELRSEVDNIIEITVTIPTPTPPTPTPTKAWAWLLIPIIIGGLMYFLLRRKK